LRRFAIINRVYPSAWAGAQGDGGTHIGLANVRDRVERLCRGSMTIDTRPGEGTTVTLRLPAASDTLR